MGPELQLASGDHHAAAAGGKRKDRPGAPLAGIESAPHDTGPTAS